MQPTMVITAPKPGVIYINGHFAGETGEQLPLMRPVNPTGAVYVEYHPLTSACRAMACRLVFSGGKPLPEAAEEAENVRIVVWPGNISEIELLPPAAVAAAALHFEAGGKSFVMDGEHSLRIDGKTLVKLPEDAQIPEYHLLTHGAALLGRCRDGMYLLTGDAQFHTSNGFLQAKQIELEPDGRIRAVIDRGDLVGHAALENWRLGPEGLVMVSSEPAWANGSPRWPQTALETVQAAVEAEHAGLHAEAEGYLSPGLRRNSPLAEIAAACELCTEMKYAVPDGRPCAAMIHLEGGVMARAQPLFYHVSPSGGAQGPYQIESLEPG